MMARLISLFLAAACAEAAKTSLAVAAHSDALATDEAPRRPNRATALLATRRQNRGGGPDMTQIVSTLNKLAKALEAEQEESKALTKKRAKDCKTRIAVPEKAIEKGKELVQEAKETLATNEGDEESLQTGITGIKKQIASAMTEIETLTTRLKNLRKSQKKAAAAASASLQQIDKVIAKEYRLEEEERKHPMTTPKPDGLGAEVSYLQDLSSHLGYMAANPAGTSGVSFLQAEMEDGSDGAANANGEGTGASAQMGVLKADRAELVKARESAKRGFNEEEKKLIELLKIKHQQLDKLQENLREQQPILADKLKQAAETKRAKDMAERVLKKDADALELAKDSCELMATNGEKLAKLRFQLINLIKMPAKLLESMDTMMFLAKDLQDLGGSAAPSFVQTKATSEMELGDAVQAALEVADAEEDKEAIGADQAPVAREVQMNLVQAALVQAETSGGGRGPFDKVSDMIKALMQSLRDQANEEMNLHQWCTEAAAKNKKDRLKIRAYMDETATEIHWAKTAIASLDDQITFFSAELKRLQAHGKDIIKESKDEQSRLQKMLQAHKNPEQTLEKVVIVLRELCELDDKDLKLVQTNSTHLRLRPSEKAQGSPALLVKDTASSKRGQCLEATKLVLEGMGKLDELDGAIGTYRNAFFALSKTEVSRTNEAIGVRAKGLRSAKADRAKRASDLATSENDKKQSEKDLALIEEAKQQQEQKCQKTETREDRMARRAEEIEALKNALKVLEGEEVPVESLAQTGAAPHTVHS